MPPNRQWKGRLLHCVCRKEVNTDTFWYHSIKLSNVVMLYIHISRMIQKTRSSFQRNQINIHKSSFELLVFRCCKILAATFLKARHLYLLSFLHLAFLFFGLFFLYYCKRGKLFIIKMCEWSTLSQPYETTKGSI